jgi:hypothetical protein
VANTSKNANKGNLALTKEVPAAWAILGAFTAETIFSELNDIGNSEN